MSIIAIIVIVAVVALVLGALFLVRFGRRAKVKKRELELRRRRKRVIEEHHQEAERRERKADEAELRARIAEQEARRERAEARVREEMAARHERGMADHELVEEHERERFAGTSAVTDTEGDADRERSTAYVEGRRSAEEPDRLEDFRAGRRDGTST